MLADQLSNQFMAVFCTKTGEAETGPVKTLQKGLFSGCLQPLVAQGTEHER